MSEGILTLLISTFSSGVAWFASRYVERRKRNNDFISEQQKTLDEIGGKYSETLKQLYDLKKQNIELLLGQEQMQREIATLRTENAGLKDEIEALRTKLENVKTIKVAR